MIIMVSSIVLVPLFFWSYMWEDEFLGKWASVVTILSLVGSPIAYFVKQNEREKEKEIEKERERKLADDMEQKRTSKNLYGELFDTLSVIKGDTFPKDMLILENRDKDDKVSKTMKYYDLLDKYERQLLDEIPRVMNNLEKKFGFKPSS